jgi:hypothetical protein
MVDKECNLQAGVYKVQTFGTTQAQVFPEKAKYHEWSKSPLARKASSRTIIAKCTTSKVSMYFLARPINKRNSMLRDPESMQEKSFNRHIDYE